MCKTELSFHADIAATLFFPCVMKKRTRSSLRCFHSIEDGYHLKNSVLSLDASGETDLSFVSSAMLPRPYEKRIIATEETVAIFTSVYKKKTNSLICQYYRPFSVGNLTLELLPAGTVLGSALLYIETNKNRVLYAPHVQTSEIPMIAPLSLRKADVLLIGMHHANFDLPSREEEKAKLARAIVASKEQIKIYCASLGTAQEIALLATEQGCSVTVHQSISAINKVYYAKTSLQSMRVYRKRLSDWDIVILPYEYINRHYGQEISGVNFYVHDTCPSPSMQLPPHAEFFISRSSSGKQLKKVVSAVRAKETYIVGNYAQSHYTKLKLPAQKVQPVFAGHQPTLF